MNREEAKQLLPIITAFANGEEVEMKNEASEGWRVVNEPRWLNPPGDYRIKPKPTLRAWTRKEFPVGCLLKDESDMWDSHLSITEKGVYLLNMENVKEPIHHNWDVLLSFFRHSTDGGKTWLPCGVIE